ncbi:MAG: hypothetical protein FWE47_04160 [Oscillospiraceae bacterium]|nr:hypothetical protein [Oscillospiraceae bacterium]
MVIVPNFAGRRGRRPLRLGGGVCFVGAGVLDRPSSKKLYAKTRTARGILDFFTKT